MVTFYDFCAILMYFQLVEGHVYIHNYNDSHVWHVWYPINKYKPGNSGTGTEPIATGLRQYMPSLSMPYDQPHCHPVQSESTLS